MPCTCVIGLQWGDEAKGKIVDLLTDHHEIVVRYQGGPNAGHTVVFGNQTFKLSLVPSGIFRSHVQCVIANGVVVHPGVLLQEINGLRERGVEVGSNLLVSDRAHVIFPWHIEEDRLLNAVFGGEAIGTTLRGIGPCYKDKAGRSLAIRLGDLYRPGLRERIERIARTKSLMLSGLDGKIDFDPESIYREYAAYAEQLRPHVTDTTKFLLNAAESGRSILFEGAQGSLLDIDHGTFPYVTSSNSSGLGVTAGSGVPAKYITKVIGVIKAYTTRVGGGPFPTELTDEIGQHIRERGNEYGTVTRRPRRCGWFDAVAVRYSARLSGVDELAVMLLDVLSELPEVRICRAYEIDGIETTDFPSHTDDLRMVRPVYDVLPGWQTEIRHVRTFDQLPANAKAYLERIRQLVERPISIVSVGPDRLDTVFAQR